MKNNITISQYFMGGIILFILLILFIIMPLNIYPAEDATILFQFSENLANTGSIVYNIGGSHAEGATDFLWMIILSCMYWFGMNTYLASTILSMLALIGTALLLFKISHKSNLNYLFLFLLILIILPTTAAAIEGFSPLFFGFFIVLTIYYFIEKAPEKLFLSALFLCLVRPDGVVFALPIIILFFMNSKSNIFNDSKKLLIYFILPGLLYFIWRWNYFGEFLPLPFYVKSNFDRFLFLFNLESLKQNIFIVCIIFLPMISFVISSFFTNKSNKNVILLAFAIVFIPFIFYSSMMLSQNISNRFQYSMIISIFAIVAYILQRIHYNKKIFFILLTTQILAITPLSIKNYSSLLLVPDEQITYIAKGLNKITTDASMAVTEAGRLPYYSKWNTVDTWGLNTKKYAKRLIMPNDIRTGNFDLIVVHASGGNYNSLLDLKNIKVHNKRTWKNMTDNIFKGIDLDDYTLYMVPFIYPTNSFLPSLYYKLRHIKRNFLGNHSNSKHIGYSAYFVKNKFKDKEDVDKLLKKYHAITFKEYMSLNDSKLI